jgi:hypothetical protein
MKIRNGFVSNSSSSSFVFGLPKDRQSVEDIQALMFEGCIETYDWYKVEPVLYPGVFCAEALKRDSEPFDPKRNVRTDDWWRKGERDPDGPRHMIDSYDYYEGSEIDRMIKTHPDHDFFIVEYEDNCGSLGSAMEHGDHWEKVPSVRISHH